MEPIAIVGIGCRLPGDCDTPDSFWDFLSQGKDAISEVPDDRWSKKKYFNADKTVKGTSCTRWGGFVSDIDKFDAEFFGISPREVSSSFVSGC